MNKKYRSEIMKKAYENRYMQKKETRKMIKLQKYNNTLKLSLLKKQKTFYYNFLITYREIDKLLLNRYITIKDINNFATITISDNLVHFNIYYLNLNFKNEITGNLETFYINLKDFLNWYNSDKKNINLLNVITKNYCKINFKSNKNLKIALKDKLKKHQLKKIFSYISRSRFTNIDIFDDFMDYSFYFQYYHNNEKGYNGGIIYHDENKKYSTHT